MGTVGVTRKGSFYALASEEPRQCHRASVTFHPSLRPSAISQDTPLVVPLPRKKRTETLLHRRKQIIEEWASGPYDYIGTQAVHFSGAVRPYADDSDERDRLLAKETDRRARWLRKQFPSEMWRLPILTSLLLPEAGWCYMNGAHYATIAMYQAVVESVIRRQAKGSETPYQRLVTRLAREGTLTKKEKMDLIWLARIRNPSLHTGSYEKYAKALTRALMAVIARGTATEKNPIESDCRRAIKTVVRLLHHLCIEPPEPDF